MAVEILKISKKSLFDSSRFYQFLDLKNMTFFTTPK